MLCRLIPFILALLFAGPVVAGTFTISGEDSRCAIIDGFYTTTNYGTETYDDIGYGDGNAQMRLLIDFPTLNDSMVALGSQTWDSATIGLIVYEYWGGLAATDSVSITTHALTAAYVEAQTTWTIRSTGNDWTSAGGDFSATRETNAYHPDSVILTDLAADDTVRCYISGETLADTLGLYGLIVKPSWQDGSYPMVRLQTDDYGTAAKRPFLIVYYSDAGPGPATGVHVRGAHLRKVQF